ncbi:heavy metal translocating P-type ATPase [Methylocella silvestris BL2]|uniref:P-type Zn(2+) transporter n=1 Tax=Methylocella silvestris (strain DSM 15510 / CIP 108128 / LMG 27833 / NCIMB 13906 / BL2) TaxID=395965 RepID=B8ETC0_METSB|nr:heavy metal translocating P-type ATPase [Methylocella silvestris]ACK51762.1 heavy metal translocating P-type ATPase [Methylocella silvestris BL2]
MTLASSSHDANRSSRAKSVPRLRSKGARSAAQPVSSRPARRSAGKPGAVSAGADLQISFPGGGRIEFHSEALFSDPRNALARQFFERAFLAPEVVEVEIDADRRNATIFFRGDAASSPALIKTISRFLSRGRPASDATGPLLFPASYSESEDSVVRLRRHGQRLSTWAIKHELEGRVRLQNPALLRKRELCQAIERELMNAFGVDRFSTNELTGTVLVYYDPKHIQKRQLIEILDEVLVKSKHIGATPIDLDLPLCTASAALAVTSQFLVPALTPLSAALFFYSVIPSFKNAYQVLFKEKRLGVDVLDAIVVLVCLGTGQVVAGTVLALTLSIARKLVQKTEDDSKKMLLNVFGKQPRFVWLSLDGIEVETPLEKLKVNDVIIVHTGETMPVDGEVVDGMAMIDQHALTGESAPAEKIKGDKVFASTIVLAGKIRVAVKSAGEETTSAKLARILNDTAGYKLRSQSWGEAMADKAVAPTLALGAIGLATVGVNSAVAIVNCDLGTGIRVAAPIGMLTSLTLCAQQGILVKDGRALESMCKVDTFLFDKTGTLTRERPEVGRVLTYGAHSEEQILQWAAAAENKFSHPIAKAIIDKFKTLGLPLPETDDSKYHVGYGITVGVDGHTVRVGSARFMKHEGIRLPEALQREMESVHGEGDSLIMVGVDDSLGGAIELRAAERPEAAEVIAGLRARGAKHLAIISGDHDLPTRKLAERLGMDRYFAEVLPQDKAKYVERLQQEGRTVCFIGDGVNDSIALKKANVSISLRGASSIATDTAQVVFMEDSLTKLLQLHDVSRDLQRNINRSWGLILVPNLICIGGALFGGFGVMHSMVFNQVGGLLALGNGLLPLRKVAQDRAEKERLAASLANHLTV